MSFHAKLTSLLKTDPRFVDDESELILAAIQDHAWKIDSGLVKLLSDKDIKARFFEMFNLSEEDKKLNKAFYGGYQ